MTWTLNWNLARQDSTKQKETNTRGGVFRISRPALPGSDLRQRPFNSLDFFPDDPDRLMIRWIRHDFDSIHGVPNLVVAISNELNPLRCTLVVLVKPSG